MNFQGYRREDGTAGTRNWILVIPSVGCAQGVARDIASRMKNTVYLANIHGCGQMAEDRATVKRTLTGFGSHPNVFSVLIVGNGCEQLSPEEIGNQIAQTGKPVETITIQEVGGSRKTTGLGRKIVREMVIDAEMCRRESISVSHLTLGTECGGSDYTSGLASNPAVGLACDMLVEEGAVVVLSETPELIGAEHLLAKRAVSTEVANRLLRAVDWWESRARAAGQDIREGNPSPGNIAGGITTLEEKSLGCIHKAGKSELQEVIEYAARPMKKGLVFMDTPAHDIEQLTGMTAGGAQLTVFTTGRGTPIGSPVAPVIKVTANRDAFRRMRENMDVDLSRVLEGKKTLPEAGRRLVQEIVHVASGKPTRAEKRRQRDFAIFTRHVNI